MGALRRNLVFDKYAGKNRVTTNPYHSGGHVSGTDRRRVSAALAALLSLVGHDDEYQKEMPMLVKLYSPEWLQTYSREVEMHIYKEGDQITAQSHVLDQVRWRDACSFVCLECVPPMG